MRFRFPYVLVLFSKGVLCLSLSGDCGAWGDYAWVRTRIDGVSMVMNGIGLELWYLFSSWSSGYGYS